MAISSPYINLAIYCNEMKKRGRFIIICEEDQPIGWCTYMVGTWEDIKRFHERPMFSIVDDLQDGPIIYIDYVVCTCWCREIRDSIYQELRKRHPSFRHGVWFRPTEEFDRLVRWEAQ